jgi:hypothetical protein
MVPVDLCKVTPTVHTRCHAQHKITMQPWSDSACQHAHTVWLADHTAMCHCNKLLCPRAVGAAGKPALQPHTERRLCDMHQTRPTWRMLPCAASHMALHNLLLSTTRVQPLRASWSAAGVVQAEDAPSSGDPMKACLDQCLGAWRVGVP